MARARRYARAIYTAFAPSRVHEWHPCTPPGPDEPLLSRVVNPDRSAFGYRSEDAGAAASCANATPVDVESSKYFSTQRLKQASSDRPRNLRAGIGGEIGSVASPARRNTRWLVLGEAKV